MLNFKRRKDSLAILPKDSLFLSHFLRMKKRNRKDTAEKHYIKQLHANTKPYFAKALNSAALVTANVTFVHGASSNCY